MQERKYLFLLKSSLPRRTRGTFFEHLKSKKKRKEDAKHFLRVAYGFLGMMLGREVRKETIHFSA
jgi:hypothetical protein